MLLCIGKLPRRPLVGNLVNRGNGASPCFEGLHQTLTLPTMPGYETYFRGFIAVNMGLLCPLSRGLAGLRFEAYRHFSDSSFSVTC